MITFEKNKKKVRNTLIVYSFVLTVIIYILFTIILNKGSGNYQHMSYQVWMWRVQMYFQGSIALFGLLVIFGGIYNKWPLSRTSGKWKKEDSKIVEWFGSIGLVKFFFRKAMLDENALTEREKEVIKEHYYRTVFFESLIILLVIALLSLLLIAQIHWDVDPADKLESEWHGIIIELIAYAFYYALILLAIFIYSFASGTVNAGIECEEEIN